MKQGDQFVLLRAELPSTENTFLAMALVTLGIPLEKGREYRETHEQLPGGRVRKIGIWTFRPMSLCGKYAAKQMVQCWHSRPWIEANRDHPLAFLKQGYENYSRALDHIKSNVPLAMIRRGKRIALIPMDATPDRRRFILDKLNSEPAAAAA